jgi:hypothetical protein
MDVNDSSAEFWLDIAQTMDVPQDLLSKTPSTKKERSYSHMIFT